MTHTRILAATLLLASLALSSSLGFAQSGKLGVGQTVKDRSFTTLSGASLKLSKFKGKPLVLAFMVHGSGACHSFAPKLEKKIWQAQKSKIGVLGILVRSRKARQFKSMHQITFPVAIDSRLAREFSSDGYPFVVVLDGNRKVVFTSKNVSASNMLAKITEALKKA